MGVTLTSQQLDDLFDETEQQQPPKVSHQRLETIYSVPTEIGSGAIRSIELCEGLSLNILDLNFQDLTIQFPEHPHLIQFMVHLTGVVASSDFLYADRYHSYIGGGGIQKPVSPLNPAMPQLAVDIHFQPQLFGQLFKLPNGELPIELQPILREDDWQQIFSTKTTPQMRSIVYEIINCPLEGAIKRLYLQGKVFELVALQLAQIGSGDRSLLKPETIDRIHYAAEILRSQLEHPPDQTSQRSYPPARFSTSFWNDSPKLSDPAPNAQS